MNDASKKTALVTGANSGLGFEAAAQLAEAGWGKVILACRTEAKAEAARVRLVERTGKDSFDLLAVDTSEVASANTACDQLRERGGNIDFLLLNAGAAAAQPQFNSDGVEITWASTLVGHHVMTMRMLDDKLLSPGARIVIAGSEGARGNAPTMKVHDIEKVANDLFDGDRAAAIEALARIKGPYKFVSFNEYVSAKLVVAWWAAALSRKLPAGMTVNAVSPGSAPASGFARNAPFMMRMFMLPMMKVIGPLMGMAGSIETAARRYLAAADLGDNETGHFYATAHRTKAVGPVAIQTWPEYFTDQVSQEAGFEAVVKMTGVTFPDSVSQSL
ncbi:MAG: SDR family NAD(P)-dependent oxidoreductase [Chloroflexi bacterium]|nr:SDR family NAD(P)-dependent oxidoreductase [Chloroflexota bacterium]